MNNEHYFIRYCIIVLLFFYFISCKTVFLPHGKHGKFQGMVYDYDNTPVCGYTIRIENKYETITDINGRFSFPVIKFGAISLFGESNDYGSIEYIHNFNDPSQIVYLKIPSINTLYVDIDTALSNKNISHARNLLKRLPQVQKETLSYKIYNSICLFLDCNEDQKEQMHSVFNDFQKGLQNETY